MKYKPIYLVRHPIPTCISQLKTFHNISGDKLMQPLSKSEKFIVPNNSFNERFKKHENYLNSLNSKLERHVAFWCINNANLLNNKDSSRWETLYYEDLIQNPKIIFCKLLNSLGIDFNDKVINKINFRKPSHSNFNKDFKLNVNDQLQSYLDKFSKEELNRLQDIFDYFKILQYAAFNAYPVKLEKQLI